MTHLRVKLLRERGALPRAMAVVAGWADRFDPAARERRVRVTDGIALSPTLRLAVVEFGGRELLLSVSKSGVALLAGADR